MCLWSVNLVKTHFFGGLLTPWWGGGWKADVGPGERSLLNPSGCLKFTFPVKGGVGNGVLAKALQNPELRTS